MAVIQQHRLMLWKHWTIRKRQPIILFLEFLWPLAIFLIITSVRHIFPPELRNDCVYRARALPSAGLLPFMQGFLCNLDNKCENISSFEEIPVYKNGKINHLLNKVHPLIEQPEIQTMLSQLPTLLSIAGHAVQSLSTPESREALSRNILVGDLFKDREIISKIFVENQMDSDLVNAFLDAKIDLGQLIRVVAFNPNKSMSCSPELINQVLVFPNQTDADALLETFCRLLHSPKFIQKLVMQVNIRGLVEMVVTLLNNLDSTDMAMLLRSFGKIIDALQSIPILNSLASAPLGAETEELSSYLQHAMEFLKTMKDFNLDLDFLGELVEDIEKVVGPGEVIGHLKSVGKHIHGLISWSKQGSLKASDLARNSNSIVDVQNDTNVGFTKEKQDIITVKALAEDLNDLLVHITFIGDKFGSKMRDAFPAFDITWKLATTAISIVLLPEWNNTVQFVNGLALVFETFPGYLPSEMRMPGLHLITAMEVLLRVGANITKGIIESNQMLLNDASMNPKKWEEAFTDPSFLELLTNFLSNGEIEKILTKKPEEIQQYLCNSTAMEYLSNNETREQLKNFVCQLPINEISSSFEIISDRENFIFQLENTLHMNGETDVDTAFRKTIRSACLLSWELIESFRNLTFYTSIWKQMMSQIKVTDQSSWRFGTFNLRAAAYNLIINLFTDAAGESLEVSKVSGRNERIMSNVGAMVNLISEEFLKVPEELFNDFASYWPWVVRIFLDSLASSDKIGAVVSHRKWAAVICNQTEIDKYLIIPDEIHSQKFLNFFCVLSTYVENEILNVNWYEKDSVNQIKDMIDDQFHNYTKIVWKKTFSNVRHMFSKYGLFASISLDNMQHIESLYHQTKILLTSMNITNLLKLSMNAITTVLEFVDRQLETILPWGWKHIKALISVLDIFVQYTNKELDKILKENKVETSSLTFGLQNFTDLGRKIIRSFPEFTNGLTKILNSRLGDFVGRIFQVIRSKAKPCEDLSVTNVIDFTDKDVILELERAACTNWKFVISEIIQYPMMFKMLWKFREATKNKDLPVNWTELMSDVDQLIDHASAMTKFKGQVFPDVVGFRLEEANEAVNKFIDTMNITTTEKGLRFALVIADAALPLLENLMKTSWNFNNMTMADVLTTHFEDYNKDEQGELSYIFVKIAMKTFDISLSDTMNFYNNFKVGENVALSSIFTHFSALFGNMFESFPDYINYFLQLFLKGDLEIVIEKLRIDGVTSLVEFCHSLSFNATVNSNKQLISRESAMPTFCSLFTEPANYFSTGSYAYSWLTNIITKLAALWQNVDHSSVIVHFVDIIQGVGFSMNKTDEIIGNRLEVRREFNDLVGSTKWKAVVETIARLIVKSKIQTTLEPVEFSRSTKTNLSFLPTNLICLSHGSMRDIVSRLRNCEESGNEIKDTCRMDTFPRNSTYDKLWQFLDKHIFNLFKIIHRSLSTNPSKIKLLLDATDPFNLTCSSSATFFSVPKSLATDNSSSSALQLIVNEMCEIDWNHIMDVYTKDVGHSCVRSVESLMEISDDFAELLQLLKSSKWVLPNYLTEKAWQDIIKETTDSDGINNNDATQVFSNLINKFLELSGVTTSDGSLLFLHSVVKILKDTNDAINAPLSDSIWSSWKTVLSEKPQTVKLVQILENLPKLASTFLNTAIHPAKLRTLMKLVWTNSNSNMDSACQNLNISSYFVIPPELDVSFDIFENILCKTDWTQFVSEWKPFNTKRLANTSSTAKTTFNSVNFVSTIATLTGELLELNSGKVATFNATTTDLPWIKKSDWRPAVMAIDRLQQNLKDPNHLVGTIMEYLSIVEVFPMWNQVEAYLQFVNLQLETVVKEMRAVKLHENIYTVLTNVTLMKNLVHDIHSGVVKASHLLQQFAVMKQLQYFEVHPKEQTDLCQEVQQTNTLSTLETIINGTITSSQLSSVICNSKPNEWLNTLTSDYGMSGNTAISLVTALMNFLPQLSPYHTDAKWSRQLPFNWTMLSDTVRSFSSFIRNPPADFYPNFKWEAWVPVLKAFGYSLSDIIYLSGETMCPLLPRINYIPFKELLHLVHSQLLMADEYEKLICELPNMNLSAIYHRLKNDLKLIDTFQQVRIQIMSISLTVIEEKQSSCPPLFHAASDVVKVLNDVIIKYSTSEAIESFKKCFQKDSQAVIIKEVDKYSKLISKGLPLLNFPNITSLTSSTNIGALVETILDFMKHQIPVFFPLKNLLTINNTLGGFFMNTPANDLLIDGSINLNMLASTNFKSTKLAEIFCNPQKFTKFIKFSNSQTDNFGMNAAKDIFCLHDIYAHGIEMADVFLTSLDVDKIIQILPRLQMENLLSWNLVVSVGKNIGNLGTAIVDIKGAIGHINFNEAFNDISINSLSRLLLPMLHSSSLQKLSNGLEIMFEVMTPIISGSTFEDNLADLVDGVKGTYQFVRINLRNETIPVKDIISNMTLLSSYLLSFGFPEVNMEALQNTTFNISALLFEKKITQLEDIICDLNIMPSLFNLKSDLTTAGLLHRTLCEDSTMERVNNVINIIFQNLNIMSILKNEMHLFMNPITRKLKLDPQNVKDAIDSLYNAQKIFPVVADTFYYLQMDSNIAKMVANLNPSELARGEITGSLIASFGDMLCGHPIRTFEEYFRLIQTTNNRPPIEKERLEVKSLPSDFCQNLYKQIAYRPAGSVIWGFLKPFIRGKLLYSPENEFTNKIIHQINSTFVSMAESIDMIKEWSNGFVQLQLFIENQLNDMEALIMLPIPNSIAMGLLGPNMTNSLTNISGILQEMGNPQRLLGAASALSKGLECFEMNRFIGFSNEDGLEQAARVLKKSSSFLAGIVFNNITVESIERMKAGNKLSAISGLPKHIEYKIRMDIDDVPTTKAKKERFWKPGPEDNFIENMRYLRGFVELQDMVDRAIISMQVGNEEDNLPGTFIQQFPYPCYAKDDFGFFLRANVPAVTTLAWIFIVAIFVRELVLDREMMVYQVMLVMGLKAWINWMSWFINCVIVMFLTNIGCTVILKYGGVFPHSDPILLFVFMFIFSLSTIMFCYLISIWFQKATIAAITTVLLYLVSYLPFIIVLSLEAHLSLAARLLMNLLMSTSFSQGCMYIARFEEQEEGIQWSNIWKSPIFGDDMSLAWTIIMMAVDTVIYFVIATYFCSLMTIFRQSIKKRWYMIFQPIFTLIPKLNAISKNDQLQYIEQTMSREPLGNNSKKDQKAKVGISVRNLTKLYYPGKDSQIVAVEDLSMDFYEGQITSLLGQSGSGKTTIINMLIGLTTPKAGSATIYGRNVLTEFEEIRKNLGVCPQYNILFEYMTIREHLEFYGSLKGNLSGAKLQDDISKMLDAMKLKEKENECACNLSGGIRRRLSVAIAFVGGSRTIILDEPTSGVDPIIRRSIWDLVLRSKKGRTILLTTHHMDEAEILSDLVVIIHHGRTLCHGSPMELKKQFGSGYLLNVAKSNNGESSSLSKSLSSSSSSKLKDIYQGNEESLSIYSFAKYYIPNVYLLEDNSSDIVLCLPYCNEDGINNRFADFFTNLEEQKGHLGVSTYSLSCTTLEQVFMNICLQADAGLPITTQGQKVIVLAKSIKASNDKKEREEMVKAAEYNLNSIPTTIKRENSRKGVEPWLAKSLYQAHYTSCTGTTLKLNQFKWLLTKRLHNFSRNWRAFITCIVLPCLFVAMAMGFTLIRPTVIQSSPSLLLTPSLYGPSVSSFIKVHPNSDDYSEQLSHMIKKPPGIGTTCMADPPSGLHTACKKHNSFIERQSVHKPQCACETPGQPVCDSRTMEFTYDRIVTNTTDILYDLIFANVTEWLMATHLEFTEQRYGGWIFGVPRNPESIPGSEENTVVWFNNKGYHAMPSYINSISNALLREQIDKGNESMKDYGKKVLFFQFS
ncbi:hypothetical protein CHUAL_011781 [Chamberlinius hualienensis]